MSKVTVIIPVYNAEKSIVKCLDSVINQTEKDIDILVLNDGSTDTTLSVLQKYAERYSMIKVIDKVNEGVAKTRNKGIDLAKGEFIMFMDNDDFIDPDYIANYLNAIESNRLDIVVGGYRRVNDERELFSVSLRHSEWSPYTVIAPWAKIYRRSFLQSNGIKFLDYVIGEDVYFNLQAYGLSSKIGTISYIGYNWYDNQKSISNTEHKGFKKNVDLTILFDELMKKIDMSSELMRYYMKRFMIYYLLYSGRTASKVEFMNEYSKITGWLVSHRLQSTLLPFDKQVRIGEKFSTTCILFVFEILEKCHLLPLFATVYCKGK